jgi:hypothetical protein
LEEDLKKKMRNSPQTNRRNLIIAKALFFSTAMSSVGWSRFQNNFYLDQGLTSYEIGSLKSIGLILKFFGEPFWCFVADVTDPKLVFVFCTLMQIVSMEVLRHARPLTYDFIVLIKVLRTTTAPTNTLTTTASLKLTEGTNEGTLHRYMTFKSNIYPFTSSRVWKTANVWIISMG